MDQITNLKERVQTAYGWQSVTLTPFDGNSMNDIYRVSNGNQEYLLKQYRAGEREQIIRSMSTQLFVHQQDKSAPKVQLNQQGNFLTDVGEGFVTLQEYIAGKPPNVKDRSCLKVVARHLKRLHKLLQTLRECFDEKESKTSRSNQEILERIEQARNGIKELANPCGEPDNHSLFEKLLQTRKQAIQERKTQYRPQCLQVVHGDFRPANLLINGQQVWVLDFDFVGLRDIWVEVGRAALLMSEFDLDRMGFFMDTYYQDDAERPSNEEVMEQTLDYLVYSSFPYKERDRLKGVNLESILQERLKSIQFCLDYLRTGEV